MFSLPSDLRSWTKTLVQQYGFTAGARLGQHFLVDKKIIHSILQAADLPSNARVLEVGGGFGVLTLPLLEQVDHLVVVELDKNLANGLRKIARTAPSLTVLEADILKIKDNELQQALGLNSDFYLLSNLPYEITGAFLRRFLSGTFRPKRMVLLLQKEVAERLTAGLGNMSLLALQAQLACNSIKIISQVSAQSFWPAPQVESSIVSFDFRSPQELNSLLGGVDMSILWHLARIGFSAKRKMMIKNLLSAIKIPKNELQDILLSVDIPLTARAQELDLSKWLKLSRLMKAKL